MTRKDLHNIESSFNLSSVAVRHPNDALSVESWVTEMQKDGDCVLFYKAQGKDCPEQPFLKNDDFALIIMSSAQSEFLVQYGSDTVCLDGTHGLNAYDFQMQTLLVLDDLREGFPCAFLISNRADTEIIKLFLLKVKERSGLISAKVFMSDLADASFNTWVTEMGLPGKRLFCTWHIDKAWRKNLTKIKSKEKQAEIYRLLRTLLEERDQEAFEIMLKNFCAIFDAEVKDFVSYFKENYFNNRECWTYCCILNSGINTNMHLERMHGVIKHVCLKGKRVKRLDKAIAAIMRFVRSKLINRLIVTHKGKISSKIKDIRRRHKNMEYLNQELVIPHDNVWEVASANERDMYFIQEFQQNCDCKLICVQCEICIHKYCCSCVDCSIKFNMCKHIHLLAKWRKQNDQQNVSQNVLEQVSGSLDDEELDKTDSLYLHCPSSETTTAQESHIILSEIGNKANAKPLEAQKEEILAYFQRQLDKVNSPSKLALVKRTIAPLSSTLNAAASAVSQTDLPKPPKIAHNEKITPERLWSTKKKPKKVETRSKSLQSYKKIRWG